MAERRDVEVAVLSMSTGRFFGEFSSEADIVKAFAVDDDALLGADVIIAAYGRDWLGGDAFVLFRRDGKLFEINADHCSCRELDGQWRPEETTWHALRHRLRTAGDDTFGTPEAADALRALLAPN